MTDLTFSNVKVRLGKIRIRQKSQDSIRHTSVALYAKTLSLPTAHTALFTTYSCRQRRYEQIWNLSLMTQ
jgi:hypothetical protein